MSSLNWVVRGEALSIIGARFAMDGGQKLIDVTKESFARLISLSHPEALLVAEIISLDFRELLHDPNMPLNVACQYYNILYQLYWCGAQRLTDMQRFDSRAVLPFTHWLERNYPAARISRRVDGVGRPLRIGYFCSWANYDRGNAMAPLIKSIAIEHAKNRDREITIYCTMFVSEEFIRSFDGTLVTIKNIAQGHEFRELDRAANQIRADAIDVLVADAPTAVATYLFGRRVAPVQMWIDMGYPFWSIGELDWVLLPSKGFQPFFGVPSDRWSPLHFRQHADTLVRPVSASQLAEARAMVPEGGFVMACFTRLVKVTPEYARMVRRLLRALPGARFLLVGSGASHDVELLTSDPEIGQQVILVRGLVDLNVFARVIDVFLDTFPFVGGLAAREVAACGVPVVSMLAGDWDTLVLDDRDHELCARTEDEYCALVGRLAHDGEFREACRQRSQGLGKRYVDVDGMMGMIEDGINKAIDYVNGRVDRMFEAP